MDSIYIFMRKHHTLTNSGLVFYGYFLCNTRKAFNAYPVAYFAAPRDDTSFDVGSFANGGSLQNSTVFESASRADFAVCPNDYIRPKRGTFLNSCILSNDDPFAMFFFFDFIVVHVCVLSKEVVLGFARVEPKLIFESQTVQLPFIDQSWESLSLEHTVSERNTVQYRHIEQVYASVDFVTDEMLWFLHVGLNVAVFSSD